MVNYDKKAKKEQKKEKEIEINKLKTKINALEAENKILKELKHDIGKFASQALGNGEYISSEISKKDKKGEFKELINIINSVNYTLSYVSSRMVYADIELNDGILTNSNIRSGIYKKFDKANRILKSKANKKNIKINFLDKSNHQIEITPAFDMVPFIILDNAIKYSPNDNQISIKFDETQHNNNTILDVTISSIGPYVNKAELDRITDRGYRCKTAETISDGEGLGLYIIKNIIKHYNIKIDYSSTNQFSMDNIDYGIFMVKLTFTL